MGVLLSLAVTLSLAGALAAHSDQRLPPGLQQEVAPAPLHVAEDHSIRQALVSLPIAAALGAALAFRPQRRGTPPHTASVIHTQIILAMVGALVMVVVGSSLARAFGIVGAASLVRYRAKVDDTKDAGVMLACLGIGLAAGVGIYTVAAICTVSILVVVLALESMEPETRKQFLLKVKAKEPAELRNRIEEVLGRNDVKYELRASSKDDLTYAVKLPLNKKTDRLTNLVQGLGKKDEISVEWSDKKAKEEV
jgi:uncharacterized protein DUF4956/MgtC family protein